MHREGVFAVISMDLGRIRKVQIRDSAKVRSEDLQRRGFQLDGPHSVCRARIEAHRDELIPRPLQEQLRKGWVPEVNPDPQLRSLQRSAPKQLARLGEMYEVFRLIRGVKVRRRILLGLGGSVRQRDPRQDLEQDVFGEVVDGEEIVSFNAQVREMGLNFYEPSFDPCQGSVGRQGRRIGHVKVCLFWPKCPSVLPLGWSRHDRLRGG